MPEEQSIDFMGDNIFGEIFSFASATVSEFQSVASQFDSIRTDFESSLSTFRGDDSRGDMQTIQPFFGNQPPSPLQLPSPIPPNIQPAREAHIPIFSNVAKGMRCILSSFGV